MHASCRRNKRTPRMTSKVLLPYTGLTSQRHNQPVGAYTDGTGHSACGVLEREGENDANVGHLGLI